MVTTATAAVLFSIQWNWPKQVPLSKSTTPVSLHDRGALINEAAWRNANVRCKTLLCIDAAQQENVSAIFLSYVRDSCRSIVLWFAERLLASRGIASNSCKHRLGTPSAIVCPVEGSALESLGALVHGKADHCDVFFGGTACNQSIDKRILTIPRGICDVSDDDLVKTICCLESSLGEFFEEGLLRGFRHVRAIDFGLHRNFFKVAVFFRCRFSCV